MSGVIRIAEQADTIPMAALNARASGFPWTQKQYEESLLNHHCFLLEENNSLVGLLVYASIIDEVELLNIVVDPQFQGQGFGQKLLAFLLDKNCSLARHVFLEVRESNTAAICLYRRQGFIVTGRRKKYYPAKNGREDALLMSYEFN